MSKNINELPFTEMVERIQELARERAETEQKTRGVLNDVYTRDIPKIADWSFLLASTSLTMDAEYKTGTATANTGATTVTFSSDVSVDSGMIGRRLQISGNDYPYTITGLSSSTGLTVSPSINGTSNISGATYSINQPRYSLVSDFDRFPKGGGFIKYSSGRKTFIQDMAYQSFMDVYQSTPTDNPIATRLVGFDTAGNVIIEVTPPPLNALARECEYYKQLDPLCESTNGTVSITSSQTAVTGTNTKFTASSVGDYIRIDNFGMSGDSEWYRIASITNDTTMTIATVFGLSSSTDALYTISCAPKLPVRLHQAVLLGGLYRVLSDQDDPAALMYKQEYANVLSDGKRIFKSRDYSQNISMVAEDYRYRR